MGQSIPLVCQDWANTKAAYRFLSNDRVSEADILAGHFQSTRNRTVATDGLVLVLHGTTEFTYQREDTDAIGITKSINSRRDEAGRLRSHTVCGILMHSSLAVTTDGLPLGLAAVKFWTRKKFKGTAALPKRTRLRPTYRSSLRCPSAHRALMMAAIRAAEYGRSSTRNQPGIFTPIAATATSARCSQTLDGNCIVGVNVGWSTKAA
jgi:Transposase DNA-binding